MRGPLFQELREAAPGEERKPDTAIIVPVHNALEHVQRCLPSLVATCPRLPLIVVDDGSDEETHRWLRHFLVEECPGPYVARRALLRNERQQLFTRTVNRGLRWAHYRRQGDDPLPLDYVAVVNSDCCLSPGWLGALRAGMQDLTVGMVGYCDRADGRAPLLRELREPDYVGGHCFLLRLKMLEQIGILCETDTDGTSNPDLAPYLGQAHYGSDRTLSWRANRAGWKTLECHAPGCAHAGHASGGADPAWLRSFDLWPLWPPCDQLEHPTWREKPTALAGRR